MTEKQKMLNGYNYNSRDPELIKAYYRTKKLLKSYNGLDADLTNERDKLLTELLLFKGNGVWIEAPFFCDFGEHISIEKNTFINANCVFLGNNKITIGKNGLIGPNVQLYTATHPLKASERIVTKNSQTHYLTSTKPIVIGDNVWIGGNTVILPGIKIGDNVTVGAGSVVTKNIPSDVLAFGNPCEMKRKL